MGLGMSQQLSLFDADNRAAAASNGITALVKGAMHAAAAASPLSRAQIMERMNRIAKAAGRRMTSGKGWAIHPDQLEKWLNPESDAVPSLQALDIFMRAVGTVEPLATWASSFGCGIMTEKQAKVCRWAEEELTRKVKAKAHKRLEEELLQEVLR